jgi:crotonobetainyl-CoA:carnitine CoA-transferase CaiB-like acyl-CoA transferase
VADANLPPGPLAGVRVLDLTDERAIYGAKLLADLNADVIRAEAPGGDPLRKRGPFTDDDAEGGSSLWHALYASNRRFVTVDPTEQRGRRLLAELIGWADIVIDCGWLAEASLDPEALVEANPSLVVVRVSSFGPDGPWADLLAPELVAAALGGFASTTGDVDTPPLTGFGDLNFLTSGTYAAIAALTALRHVRESGEGQVVEVPVHSVIASCLEHVLMFYWYQQGRVLPRQGSVHWTSAYEVMRARGGHIMVTPTPDFQRNIAWLVEEDVHEDLLDEHYYQPDGLLLLIPRVMEVLRAWVATKDVEQFFFESQARHHPYGWVLTPDRVASNPQLEARQWWADYEVAGSDVRGPGAPYRFLGTPWALRRGHGDPGADSDDVLAEIGWAE